jgi:uncharacterized protein YggE
MAFFSSADTNQDWQTLLMKAGFVLLVVGSVFLLILSINQIRSGQFIGEADRFQNTISVSGEGEVFAVPDTAQFTFTVTEEAEAVADAQESVTQRANDIMDFLQEQGIEEADLKTTGYDINPRYEFQDTTGIPRPPRGSRTLVGYEVSQTTQVTVRDTDQVGGLLSGLGQRDVSSVSNVSFTVEDKEGVRQEARNKAITDAKQKARELADQLDVKLGDVVNFNESSNQPQFRYDVANAEGMGGDGQVSTPQISPGENRVTSNVNITYEMR